MKRKLAFAALYSLFGVLTYFLFLYLTFPSDVARDRLVYEANKAGVRMQLVGFRPALPWGLTLTGVDIYGFGDQNAASKRAKPRRKVENKAEDAAGDEPALAAPADAAAVSPAPGDAPVAAKSDAPAEAAEAVPAETPLLTLDRVTVSSLLPLVMPSASSGNVNFDAALYGGELEGSFGREGDLNKIVLAMTNIDLARYPMKGESYDIKASGKFGLNTDLALNREKIRESTGTINLNLENLVLHKGSKVKGFDIPMELAFKVSGGAMEVKNGRAELAELKLESAPLTILVDGSIMLNVVPSRSRFNLKVALKFGDELKVVSAFLPETARSEDGFYHYVLSGPFDNIRTRPDRLAARRKDRGVRPTGGADDRPTPPGIGRVPGMPGGPMAMEGDGGPMRPPVLDDAERERLREERRKRAEERRRRREELRQRRLEMSGETGAMEPGRPLGGPEGEMNEPGDRPPRRVRPYDSMDNDGPEDMPPDIPEPMDEPQPWEEPAE